MDRYEKFQNYLKDIAPYIIVVGSFARGEETINSDIDCYIKSRPAKEREDNYDLDETYMPEILEITKRYGYQFSSCIIGHIAIDFYVPRMIELSSHYMIPKTTPITKRFVEGVELECAIDDKEAPYEECLGYIE